MSTMNKDSKIYIAGHNGLVGSAIMRNLKSAGYMNLLIRSHNDLDLLNQSAVDSFFKIEKPEYVFLAAAKVGGIAANSQLPGDFLYQNTMIGFNVVNSAFKHQVKKLLNLGSSCIYPKFASQPLKEEYLLTGPLEPTNEAYAIAKIAVIKLCNSYNKQYGTDYISVMPTNLYGPGDNYDENGSHVLPALIRKFHEAKMTGKESVVLWGDGSPFREFLYSEDLADGVVFLMENYTASVIGELINIGCGHDLPIAKLAEIVRDIVYVDSLNKQCQIFWDLSKPNGTPRKLLDISRIKGLGWSPKTELVEGIRKSYNAFLVDRT